MTMWKKNLGTSLTAGGTVLMGIGVVPQLGGVPSKVLTYVALFGFVLVAAGSVFSHLFSVDTTAAVAQNAVAIADTKNLLLTSTPQAVKQAASTPNNPLPPTQTNP